MPELAPGLWHWTARHPDWQPGHGWDPDVSCFYVEADDATLFVDPLVTDEAHYERFDAAVAGRGKPAAVLLTCPAHARSAGEVAARYGAEVWAHENTRGHVGDAPFRSVKAGDRAPGDARVLGVDDPATSGTPLYLPSHRALAVGDTLISVDGELRVWWWSADEEEERFYREIHLPSLERWLELDIECVLVAHGEQIPGGRELVAAAVERPPYEHI